MFRVDTRPRRRNAARPAHKSAVGFLQWVRGRKCLAAAHSPCWGKVEAAHVDYAGDKGMGTKVSDRYAVPLCSGHHGLQTAKGWRWFDQTVLGKAQAGLEAAGWLWARWPGRAAWERKQNNG